MEPELLIFEISLMLLKYYLLFQFQRAAAETQRSCFFSSPISLYLFPPLPLWLLSPFLIQGLCTTACDVMNQWVQ